MQIFKKKTGVGEKKTKETSFHCCFNRGSLYGVSGNGRERESPCLTDGAGNYRERIEGEMNSTLLIIFIILLVGLLTISELYLMLSRSQILSLPSPPKRVTEECVDEFSKHVDEFFLEYREILIPECNTFVEALNKCEKGIGEIDFCSEGD